MQDPVSMRPHLRDLLIEGASGFLRAKGCR